MSLVVDSCVLLDIALRDPEFGIPSALLLESRRKQGLVACPISIVEICPQFDGKIATTKDFLRLVGADADSPWLAQDTERAAEGWVRYVSMKRAGKTSLPPVADILIGAFSLRFDGLVTRNPSHFLPYFPALTLIDPTPPTGA